MGEHLSLCPPSRYFVTELRVSPSTINIRINTNNNINSCPLTSALCWMDGQSKSGWPINCIPEPSYRQVRGLPERIESKRIDWIFFRVYLEWARNNSVPLNYNSCLSSIDHSPVTALFDTTSNQWSQQNVSFCPCLLPFSQPSSLLVSCPTCIVVPGDKGSQLESNRI